MILLSGHISAEDLLHRAEEEGNCFEMLEKPVHPQVLLDRLAALCEGFGARPPASEHGVEFSRAETAVDFNAKTSRGPGDKSSMSRRTRSSNAVGSKWCN